MTKEDYKAIAKVILWCNSPISRRKLVYDLCIVFSKDNPSFNPEKFADACYGRIANDGYL